MARTRTGVKITDRFLRRDKRDMKKFYFMLRLKQAGKLTERGLKTLRGLVHKYHHRYGKGRRQPAPEAKVSVDLKNVWNEEEFRELLLRIPA